MSKNIFSYGLSLQARIMLFISLTIFLTITISTLLYVDNFKKNYLEAIEWRSLSLAKSIELEVRSRYQQFERFATLAGTDLLLETTYLQCKKIYEANAHNHVSFIAVLDQSGKFVTHNDRSLWRTQLQDPQLEAYLKAPKTVRTLLIADIYHTLIPVRIESGKVLGIIDIGFPKQVVDKKIMDIILDAIAFFLIVFLLQFVLLWYYIKHNVQRPINRLILAANDIAEGNLLRDMNVSRAKEFVELSDSLTDMREVIREHITQLEFANEEIKALIACSPVALFSININQQVAFWTTPAERLFGWHNQEITGQQLAIIEEQDKPRFSALLQDAVSGKILQGQEFPLTRKDGSSFHGTLSLAAIYNNNGQISDVMISAEDISERVEREQAHRDVQAQLLHAQKMESVGRLAGGVAHDYNNMLGVILGNAELALMKMDAEDNKRRYLQEIISAAQHSADITSQLLAFARKQTISLEVIDLNLCVEKMLKMLRRLLGETIVLQWNPQAAKSLVKMDKTQIDQILANLCINARDAMPAGGTITIETHSVSVDADYALKHHDFNPGNYIRLSVSDTGIGMDKELQQKIFEPFFTTKNKGEGTGLGLATVYGIVKQNNGFINLYSEPGIGSVFNIYIAEEQEQPEAAEKTEPLLKLNGAGETILVVEDEKSILDLCIQVLSGFGYRVLSSADPQQALEMIRDQHEKIDLLMTDVIMPGMNGRELAKQLRQYCPDFRTLYMSGYTADVIANQGIIDSHVHFIQKPFSQKDLAKKLREALQN